VRAQNPFNVSARPMCGHDLARPSGRLAQGRVLVAHEAEVANDCVNSVC